MVASQKVAATRLLALAAKKAVLRDAAAFLVTTQKTAASAIAPTPTPTPAGAAASTPPGTLPSPGSKILSKGQGRGLVRGMGKGPIGIPIGSKGAGQGARPAVAPVAAAAGGPSKKIAMLKVAAELIKTSGDIKTHRKTALIKAAAHYRAACKSGNRKHIKKATAYLANVLSLVELEKQGGAKDVGTWIKVVELLRKLGRGTAGLGAKGAGGVANKLTIPAVTGPYVSSGGPKKVLPGASMFNAIKKMLSGISGGGSPNLAVGLGAGTAGVGGYGLARLRGGSAQD